LFTELTSIRYLKLDFYQKWSVKNYDFFGQKLKVEIERQTKKLEKRKETHGDSTLDRFQVTIYFGVY